MTNLQTIIEKLDLQDGGRIRELALGYLRYETIRKLSPRQYTELHQRNLKGENFDGMVDELVVKNYE